MQTVPAPDGPAAEVDRMRDARAPGIPVPQSLPDGWDHAGYFSATVTPASGHTATTITVRGSGPRRGRARAARPIPITAEAMAAERALALTVACSCGAGKTTSCRTAGGYHTSRIDAAHTARDGEAS